VYVCVCVNEDMYTHFLALVCCQVMPYNVLVQTC